MHPTEKPTGARVVRRANLQPYTPAVGPRLRILLFFVFASFALLGASGIYLFSVTVMNWFSTDADAYTTVFTLWMILFHLLLGLVMIAPFLLFGLLHWWTARTRPNQVAVKLGLLLFFSGIVVVLSGVALIQLEGLPQLPTGTVSRWLVRALHVIAPIGACVLYVYHRRAGPAIKWRWGYVWGSAVAVFVVVMAGMHSHDPRVWNERFSPEGEKYYAPSMARTGGLKHIPEHAMMMDHYCQKCHPKIYDTHFHSMHRFSSFNNPAYLFSVKETRARMGVRASRWCAGCHDPVPFFSGAFDDPKFDMVNHPTAQAGITCVVCHSITHVNSRSGNGDYVIEEPIHYPFAESENPMLQWLNNQLVKAKPGFHKKTFMKPFHRDKEMFCSTCHKVGLPREVTHYKEFLRGQNHSDSYWLSGVSGIGVRSFYYPPKSKRCADCHMQLLASDDFGARDFDGSGRRTIHDHTFLGANTGIPMLVKFPGWQKTIDRQRNFLRKGIDGKSPAMRVDIFGLKKLTAKQSGVDAPLLDDQPIRPHLPMLEPGKSYLIEVVVRTLNVGHHFTQGTVDSNEVWVDFHAKSGQRTIGRSGRMDGGKDQGRVDDGSHFINVLMLDRHGNRIDRRNAQDIFTPLYNHQIPPGAGQVVHYRLSVPRDIQQPVQLKVRVRYRKFDYTYMEKVYGKGKVPELPIVDLCEDEVALPVSGVAENIEPQTSPIKAAWQRWNDYGIGCFLEGGPDGKNGGELGQAERAFKKLLGKEFDHTPIARGHGWLNLARVYYAYGGTNDDPEMKKAQHALEQALKSKPPAPWWTIAWYSGLVNIHNTNLQQAVKNFKTILDPDKQPTSRNFDFTKDWIVRNKLGEVYYELAKGYDLSSKEHAQLLKMALKQFRTTLQYDPENIQAHDFLHRCYARLAGSKDPVAAPPRALADDEKRLQALTKVLTRETHAKEKRLEAGRQILQLLQNVGERCDTMVLVETRQQCLRTSTTTNEPWVRLLITPIVTQLDQRLLALLPGLGDHFVDNKKVSASRLQAAAQTVQILNQLQSAPRDAEVQPIFTGMSCLLQPGLPVNLALAGMAEKGYLDGPLPPARLLKLQALLEKVRPFFEQTKNTTLKQTAARILAGIHLTMHGIYKPDEAAEGRAKLLHRRRHPAAARASQSIVIYELK